MSGAARRGREPGEAPGLDLLEEAWHLLRQAPPSAFATYYLGTLPFVLGALTFWADMSRSAFAAGHIGESSFLLALLFVGMKTAHAAFCQGLREVLQGAPTAGRRAGLFRTALHQAVLQPSGLFLLPAAALLTVPFGWVFAFYQNVAVLGRREEKDVASLLRVSKAQAALWPRQNHVILAVLALFTLFVFLNVGLTVLILPGLLKTLTGIETAFTRSGFYVLNSTFLFTVLALTFLAIDPIVKAAYTVRCFHGASLVTGEDLLVSLRRQRNARATPGLATALVVGMALSSSWPAAAARPLSPAPRERPTPAVAPDQLSRSLDEVLRRREFAWRMPRENLEVLNEGGPVTDFFLALHRGVKKVVRAVASFIDKVVRLLRDLLTPEGERAGEPSSGWRRIVTSRAFLFVLLALVLAAAGLAVARALRARRRVKSVVHATPVPVPDLLSEEVNAGEREPDDWLDLGREWIEKGDFRRALRALYLASLAVLARAELIRLTAYKSNGDYARELRRRAAGRPELVSAFSTLVLEFERIWYGRHDATAEGLAGFRAELDRMRQHASP